MTFSAIIVFFFRYMKWNNQILQSSSNILWTNIHVIISYIYPPLKLTLRPVRPWNKDPTGISEIPNLEASIFRGKMLLVLGSCMDISISERWDILNLWTPPEPMNRKIQPTSIEHEKTHRGSSTQPSENYHGEFNNSKSWMVDGWKDEFPLFSIGWLLS